MALEAMLQVPVSPTGQQPLAVYCCGICERNRWHYTSKSQIPRKRNQFRPKKGKKRA